MPKVKGLFCTHFGIVYLQKQFKDNKSRRKGQVKIYSNDWLQLQLVLFPNVSNIVFISCDDEQGSNKCYSGSMRACEY